MKAVLLKSGTILTALCLLLGARPCRADDVGIDRIVVTASRTEERSGEISREIDIISRDDIQAVQAYDLAEVLNHLSSVNVNTYGGPGASKTLRMRGSTASQVLVLMDGRPINSPRDGEIDLSTIPLENIDHIEVMRGPGSDLYGSSAMGGTVHIITKKPPRQGSTNECSSSFGTFRTYQERLSHGQRLGRFGYLVSGDYQNSRGIRENSAFDAKDLSTSLEYQITDHQRISLNSGFFKSASGTPGPITSPDLDDKQTVLKNFFDLGWQRDFDLETAVYAKIYNNYDRLEFNENTAGSIFDIANDKFVHVTQTRGFNIQFNKQWSDFYKMITGFDTVLNLNNSTSTAKHRYTVLAGYINNEFNFYENLKTNLGVRVDEYSNFGFQASPSLSVLYKTHEQGRLHGLVSRSFRAPTFNDLYWPDEGWAKGNPNLTPEKGVTGEIGYALIINKILETDIVYFKSVYRDLIQWAPDAAGVWSPTNIGSALIDGIDWRNKLRPTDKIDIGLGYAFQRAIDDNSHRFLIYQPHHKVDFSIDHKNILGWMMGIRGQWTGLRFHDAANTIKVDGFFLLGVHASKTWKSGLTYYVSIDNALNKKYESVKEYPAPAFSLTSGIKYKF